MNDKIIKIYKQKLIYLNYSENTIKIYVNYVSEFLKSFKNRQVIHLNYQLFGSLNFIYYLCIINKNKLNENWKNNIDF